jgi:DNA-binding protein HU-beta
VNKAQLIEELSTRFDGNKREAQRALEAVLDVVTRAVAKGEKVAITGFGAFEKVERAARTARNPATGASVKVKKTSVPKFRPGAELKAVVSGAKKLPRVATTTARSAATTAKATTTKATGGTSTKATTAKRPAKSAASKKAATAKKATTKKATTKKATTTKKSTSTKRAAKKS